MVVGRNQDEAPALGLAEPEEEAGVGFFVDHRVHARGADPVAAHLPGAVVLVEHGIEHGLAVGAQTASPWRPRWGPVDGPVDDRAGGDIADEEPVALRAVEVEGVGEAAVVGAMLAVADPEIGLPLRLAVAVEQQHLRRFVVAGRAAVERMLAAVHVADVVGPVAIGRGHRRLVLLHAPAHLGVERLPQRLVGREEGVRVGVLGLQVGADLRVERVGLAHDPLPVGILEPGVIVAAGDPVQRRRDGLAGRDGGRGGGSGHGGTRRRIESALVPHVAGCNHPAEL